MKSHLEDMDDKLITVLAGIADGASEATLGLLDPEQREHLLREGLAAFDPPRLTRRGNWAAEEALQLRRREAAGRLAEVADAIVEDAVAPPVVELAGVASPTGPPTCDVHQKPLTDLGEPAGLRCFACEPEAFAAPEPEAPREASEAPREEPEAAPPVQVVVHRAARVREVQFVVVDRLNEYLREGWLYLGPVVFPSAMGPDDLYFAVGLGEDMETY